MKRALIAIAILCSACGPSPMELTPGQMEYKARECYRHRLVPHEAYGKVGSGDYRVVDIECHIKGD